MNVLALAGQQLGDGAVSFGLLIGQRDTDVVSPIKGVLCIANAAAFVFLISTMATTIVQASDMKYTTLCVTIAATTCVRASHAQTGRVEVSDEAVDDLQASEDC